MIKKSLSILLILLLNLSSLLVAEEPVVTSQPSVPEVEVSVQALQPVQEMGQEAKEPIDPTAAFLAGDPVQPVAKEAPAPPKNENKAAPTPSIEEIRKAVSNINSKVGADDYVKIDSRLDPFFSKTREVYFRDVYKGNGKGTIFIIEFSPSAKDGGGNMYHEIDYEVPGKTDLSRVSLAEKVAALNPDTAKNFNVTRIYSIDSRGPMQGATDLAERTKTYLPREEGKDHVVDTDTLLIFEPSIPAIDEPAGLIISNLKEGETARTKIFGTVTFSVIEKSVGGQKYFVRQLGFKLDGIQHPPAPAWMKGQPLPMDDENGRLHSYQGRFDGKDITYQLIRDQNEKVTGYEVVVYDGKGNLVESKKLDLDGNPL